VAGGYGATVSGGYNNYAGGQLSWAGGKNIYVYADRTFAWGHPNSQVSIYTPDAFIIYSGNVGIGTTSPSYKLDVDGIIRGDNVSSSDIRLKENIETIDNALEKVSNLRGVYFDWKDKEKGENRKIGLIAQEVEEIFPEVVSVDQEGYKSLNYDKLVGALVEAVKELKMQNEELKAFICQDYPEAWICQ
jgi:hypothetical protein